MRFLLAASLVLASLTALPAANAEECSLDSGICGQAVDLAFGVTQTAGEVAKGAANGAAAEVQDCVQGESAVCEDAQEAAIECVQRTDGPCHDAWFLVLPTLQCATLMHGTWCDAAVEGAEQDVQECTSGASGGACGTAVEAVDCLLRPVPCEPFGIQDTVTACLNDPESVCGPVVECLLADVLCDLDEPVGACLSAGSDGPCSVVWDAASAVPDPWQTVIDCGNGAETSPCDGPKDVVDQAVHDVFWCRDSGECPGLDEVETIAQRCLDGEGPCDTECDSGLCGTLQECLDGGCGVDLEEVVDIVEACVQDGPCNLGNHIETAEELAEQAGETADGVVEAAIGLVQDAPGILVGAVTAAAEKVLGEVQDCFDDGPCGNVVDTVIERVEDLADI